MDSFTEQAGTLGAPAPEDASYGVLARASLQEIRNRTLKHGDTFGVFDHNGDIHADPTGAEGLFHRDTRYLSRLTLAINGSRPLLLSSTLRDDNATLTCDLTNPDLFDEQGDLRLEHDLIHIRRSRFLWKAACYERVAVRNFLDRTVTVVLDIVFQADFADLFEVRGTTRKRRGKCHDPVVGRDSVLLGYTGLDGIERSTYLQFSPRPAVISGGRTRFVLTLEPRKTRSVLLTVECLDGEHRTPRRESFFSAIRGARRSLRRASSRAAAIITSNDIFNESLRRSISDLYMLVTDTPEGPYPYAGVPWFSTVFGRDALITAFETLWIDPALARGVLFHLAANQATDLDAAADAEPGKILHEVRYGEMAELGEVPFRRYYGSIDSTPLFVMLAGAYLDRTGDMEAIGALWPHIEAGLAWIEHYGDRDGDGYLEYGRRSEQGLANQGWKDSHDSIFHSDGTLAKGPIALCEVQAYVYGAFMAASAMAERLGHADVAERFARRAESLRLAFARDFFDPELGSYVLALDGDKRPCRVLSSNAGHALWTGIAEHVHARSVAAALMGRASFSGWGVRTIAAGQSRYNPMSYHNGSVWPHDNALIAAGLARYGLKGEAVRILEGLFAAASYIDLRRLPELFCGFSRLASHGPTFYPVACIPQAWAAAAPLYTLQACLGLRFDVEAGRILFDSPMLPDFLNTVHLKRLRLNGATADISLHRTGHAVVVEVERRQGAIGVVTTT
ncbi:amylo-alpha-1,6-glucosidase [Pelagibacterium sp. H642]|uniref:amylo-alpha-1,6-glucosidase n=1 Tax=Pelagibacterium sp. H642 TaxID=1881069 RepID=UPI002814B181|nr:amylo-alpha-1,6-glucosidase [Pelagibacterium sp. H642]WMT92689.1 amylo-alpha-1,6-glucosidase [Pelagibacterium sp. H642]